MFFRQLEYLVALARERHFVRAAQSCSVSQPALSEAIRKLELKLEVPLIRRGNKFEGLTPEGDAIVLWARRILADRDALNDEVSAMRGGLSGMLRIASIPTASSAVPLLTGPFCASHDKARVQVISDLTSTEILRQLQDFEIDVGISYIPDRVPAGFQVLPLYTEQYVLLTAAGSISTPETGWASVAELPLCLLTPQMQGRRRIDEIFQAAGVLVSPRLETDSVASLFAHVGTGAWSTIVPSAWLHAFEIPDTMCAIPLIDPVCSIPVGVVTLAREPASIMTVALLAVARAADLTVLERPAMKN